jgi:Group II intron, maturase-specific domain
LALVQTWTVQHGLRLHPEKTRIVDSSKGGDGFDFLGYRFAGGRRHVRPKSLKGVRDKIRQHTARTRSGSLAPIIAELNPLLRGWFGYFKHARFTTFRNIDRRFSWGKIGSHSPPQAPVFLEDIASFCELIFLPHELDCHALIPV